MPLQPWHESAAAGTSSPLQLLPKMVQVAAQEAWPSKCMALLGQLSGVLTDKALRRNEQLQPALSLPSPLGVDAFLHPAVELKRASIGRRRIAALAELPNPCMEYHKGRVLLAKGMRYDQESVNDTYMEVYIGRSASNLPVYEYGHRLVAWCMLGPPPAEHEVMLTCRNPKCLSPLHLKYVTHRENMRELANRRGQRSAKRVRN